jgi:aspartyl-tRNA(Asn)/glutamyl-tRNA(Gln) amidotransferase subunit A
LRDVELPAPRTAVSAYYVIAPAEASSNLARYDGVRYGRRVAAASLGAMYRRSRTEGLGEEVKRRILLGTYTLSAGYVDAYYGRATAVRRALRREFEERLREVDLVLLPTAPTTAFRLGEKTEDPLAMYLADVFTVFANLTGFPAISVPAGRDAKGLPMGVQLLAGPWREDLLFRGAAALGAAFPPPGPPPEAA